MNSQEQEIQVSVKPEEDVTSRRRFIKGAGITTPVVLTLSSRSVFGNPCLSQILSGNESHVVAGSCVRGTSLSNWRIAVIPGSISSVSAAINTGAKTTNSDPCAIKSPPTLLNDSGTPIEISGLRLTQGGKTYEARINIENKLVSRETFTWNGGSIYGIQNKYRNQVKKIEKKKDNMWVEITQQVNINEIPAATIPNTNKYTLKTGPLTKNDFLDDFYELTGGDTNASIGGDGTKTLRNILTDTATAESDTAYLIAAFLNAKYYKLKNQSYALDEGDVIKIANGSQKVPKDNIKAFLSSTW